MIPIRDTTPSRNYPVVNTIIISVNVFLFLIQMTQAQGQEWAKFVYTYGLVPARYSAPEISTHFTFGQQVLSFISYMFVHGGFWHLLGNMWSLYIFGDNVEDRLGSARYLLFYILCGLASGMFHLALNWGSRVPTIGASGAIAGVMGAYALLYPKSKILTLIPIFFIPYFVELPAVFFLGLWFFLQFLSAAGTQAQGGGIAWWAHIGGFIFGIAFLKLFLHLPESGLSALFRRFTAKSKSPRLQTIRPVAAGEEGHLYGLLDITPSEARFGTHKLVKIPRVLQKRLYKVNIPPGIQDGTVLRLEGMGKSGDGGKRGDLYLKVSVRNNA